MALNILRDIYLDEEDKRRNLFAEERKGHWEGWIKPSLKEFGKAATVGTVETIGSLASSMALYPISKSAGVSQLIRGKSAEEARQAEEYWAGKAYQPTTESGRSATEAIGTAFELGMTPSRMAGEGATELIGEKTGYLTQLAGELFTFKMAGGIKAKAGLVMRQRSTARSMLNKKLNELTVQERLMVEKIVDTKYAPRNIVKEEIESKKPPAEAAYETQKDIWIGEKDVRLLEANVESRLLQKEIKTGYKTEQPAAPKNMPRLTDEAIELYIDTKRNPSHVEKYYDQLKPEQKKVVDLSQNLPEYAKKIADKIEQSYQKIGTEAFGEEVVRNLIDNYASRKWDLEGKETIGAFRKFGTVTGHAKQRKFGTIIEGWANGYELKIKSATENLKTYKHEVIKTIEDKKFVGELRKLKDLDGKPLLSTQQLPGYIEVEHPNMKVWEWAGKAEGAKAYGKNFFATEDGRLMERRSLYAPKEQAKNINNILGTSKLYGTPGVKEITKFTETTKAWVLQSSLFHHMAFMRSFYLPGMRIRNLKITPRQAYRQGLQAIDSADPVVMYGVRKGLTLGLKQDWSESLLREKTRIGRVLDKTVPTKTIKDILNRFRESQADFLFGEFGAGLKAKTYMMEFKEQIKKYPNQPPDMVAARVARLINDDFGGLHLQRLGRNPTLQHTFKLFALAPDWTESNIRTMAKTIKNMTGDQAEIYMYRKFWGGVVLKGVAATALSNYAMSGGNITEMIDNYKKAWESGNFNWMKVDITPIYKLFGGETERKKYFSVIGHFQDPIKFIVHPIKSAKHKASITASMGLEALTGSDWAGRNFTTFEDLLKEGLTVKWGRKSGPVDYDQFPSYVLSQLMGTQPIQVQNFIGYLNGEMEGFDALLKSAGLRVTSTYEKKKKGLKTLKGLK